MSKVLTRKKIESGREQSNLGDPDISKKNHLLWLCVMIKTTYVQITFYLKRRFHKIQDIHSFCEPKDSYRITLIVDSKFHNLSWIIDERDLTNRFTKKIAHNNKILQLYQYIRKEKSFAAKYWHYESHTRTSGTRYSRHVWLIMNHIIFTEYLSTL